MDLRQLTIPLLVLGCLAGTADAALLSMEFQGGVNEVALAPGQSVRVDIIWTMHATDTPKNRLSELDLRFNVNAVPDPNGITSNDKFIVESASTSVPGWTMVTTQGVGNYFSEGNFFLAGLHPDGDLGPVGNGTEFSTTVLSFVLRKADDQLGDTYITFRHRWPDDILPFAGDDVGEWQLRFQTDIDGPGQFDIGQGNPGDDSIYFAPYHGFETFQPLIIHNLPEPAGVALLAMGALRLTMRRRRG